MTDRLGILPAFEVNVLRHIDALIERINRPVNISSLVVFRILFGLLMAWDCIRYLKNGWVLRNYSGEVFRFSYPGFHWVKALPAEGMYAVFIFAAVLALAIAAGWFYRVVTLLFAVTFTYIFLIDKANYLNHFYLICLMSYMMAIIPAHRAFSFDARRHPISTSDTVPWWCLWILRLQLVIVYFYAGIAKIKYDWLFRAEPIGVWIAEHSDWPVIGPWFEEFWIALAFAWGGMLLDILIGPALLWTRTRTYAVVLLVIFHVSNAFLFNIGVFPWMMIAATSLFFKPDWPHHYRRLWPEFEERKNSYLVKPPSPWNARIYLFFVLGYFCLQLLLPFRHHLFTGDVNWNKMASRFSWRMKLNRRTARLQMFYSSDQTGDVRQIIDLRRFVTSKQSRKMTLWPDMVHDFAYHHAKHLRKQGHTNVKIYAWAEAGLNGRPKQPLFDDSMNLLDYPRFSWDTQPWIVALRN